MFRNVCGIIEQLSDLIYFVLALLWLSVICYKVRISPDKFEMENKTQNVVFRN